jgi:hypothetical protein
MDDQLHRLYECIEKLTEAMAHGKVESVTVSRETAGDALVTVRCQTHSVTWTKTDPKTAS